jgi:hypothetical protein
MQVRFRVFEHLMRSMLESQAAMMASMTQLQQALLSKMAPKPLEIGAEARQQRVLGQHRDEVGDPVVSREAGEQGDADVHHARGF